MPIWIWREGSFQTRRVELTWEDVLGFEVLVCLARPELSGFPKGILALRRWEMIPLKS
jgi:hypothetical protein